MTIDRAMPILAVLLAGLTAIRNADWPGVAAFVAAMSLYGAMRFLERNRANDTEQFKEDLAQLKSKVSDLAMRSSL